MISRYSLINFFFVVLALCIVLALSSNLALTSFFNSIKYLALVIFVSVFLLLTKPGRFDLPSFSGYLFFIFFTVLFTVINYPDYQSMMILSGYIVLFIVWFAVQSHTGAVWVLSFFSEKIYGIVFLHIVLSLFYIFEPGAYTFHKAQYTAYFLNPNAFAGITGLFIVLLLSQFQGQQRFSSNVQLVFIGLLGILLILSGSRSAMLCVALGFITTNIKLTLKLGFIGVGVFIAIFVYIGSYFDQLIGIEVLSRDLMEDTGRGRMLQGYFSQIFERSIIIGTGLSDTGGRIKSELAYVDMLLFSGVGAFGFYFFVIVGLMRAHKAAEAGYHVMFPVMVFVASISLFEGYLSNVMAIPTIVFYIFHGVSNYLSKRDVVL